MENSKKLVVYYSYTGHTKMIAKRIEEKLGCDILEIKPIIPYSTNYQTVVNKEQNNESSNKTPQIEKIDKDLKKYDEIIKSAIANHNKYIVDFENMNNMQALHSKLIRDADKLDSFRAKYEEDIYTMANITKEEIENSLVSDNILNSFMNEKTILSKDRKTPIDIWISYIAFIYGLYFRESLNYIYELDYVNKLVDKFNYKIEDTKKKMKKIKEKGNKFISKRRKIYNE